MVSGTLAALVATMALLFGGGVGATASQPAMAFDLFNPCGNLTADDQPARDWWPGVLSMLSSPTVASALTNASTVYGNSNNATAYEWYGTAGMAPYAGAWADNNNTGCTFFNQMASLPADLLRALSALISEFGLLIISWALSADIVSQFILGDGAVIPSVIDTLRENLYVTYMVPIVLLSSLWIGWRGVVKRRSSEALQGIVWVFAASSVAMAFLLNPVWIIKAFNDTVNVVGVTLVDSISSTAAGSPTTRDMCSLPSNAANRGSRMVQCDMWRTFIYQPWAAQQFGSIATDPALQVGGGNTSAATFRKSHDLAIVFLDQRVATHDEVLGHSPTSDAKRNAQWDAIVTTMTSDAAKPGWPNFTGNNIMGRFSIAILGLITLLAGAIPAVFLAFTIVVQQFAFVFLLLLAPIFLTFGIHPGAGRRMVLSWLEMVLGTATKRIVSYAIFAILLGMIAAIANSTGNGGGLILQSLLMIAASLSVMAYRKRILDRAGQLNLGGGQLNTGDGRAMSRTAQSVLTGLVAGAVEGHIDDESNAGKGAVKGAVKGSKGNMTPGAGLSNVRAASKKKAAAAAEAGQLPPGAAELDRAEREQKAWRREDAAMNGGRATAEEWVAWSRRNGGREVPRPRDNDALVAELEGARVPMRMQVDEMTRETQPAGGSPRPADVDASGAPDTEPQLVPVPALDLTLDDVESTGAGVSGGSPRPVSDPVGDPVVDTVPGGSSGSMTSMEDFVRAEEVEFARRAADGSGSTTRPGGTPVMRDMADFEAAEAAELARRAGDTGRPRRPSPAAGAADPKPEQDPIAAAFARLTAIRRRQGKPGDDTPRPE